MIEIIKEIAFNWSIKNRKLAGPFTILRRVISLPFVLLFGFVACVFVFIGYGYYEAKQLWNDIY